MKKSYLLQVLWHKWLILVAGVKMGNFPLWRLIVHDWTKFLPAEYRVYKRKFTGKEFSKEEWRKAWEHHYTHNPHHYQYWIKDGAPRPMPEIFVREMVIDWMAAGRSYQGSWNIQEWLDTEHSKMNLHPDTMATLGPILHSQGFTWPENQ